MFPFLKIFSLFIHLIRSLHTHTHTHTNTHTQTHTHIYMVYYNEGITIFVYKNIYFVFFLERIVMTVCECDRSRDREKQTDRQTDKLRNKGLEYLYWHFIFLIHTGILYSELYFSFSVGSQLAPMDVIKAASVFTDLFS